MQSGTHLDMILHDKDCVKNLNYKHIAIQTHID